MSKIRMRNTGWRFVSNDRENLFKAYTPDGTVHSVDTRKAPFTLALQAMLNEMIDALSTPHPTGAQVINTTMYTEPIRVLDGETVDQAMARARSVSTLAQQFDRACAVEQIDPEMAKRLRERLFGKEKT